MTKHRCPQDVPYGDYKRLKTATVTCSDSVSSLPSVVDDDHNHHQNESSNLACRGLIIVFQHWLVTDGKVVTRYKEGDLDELRDQLIFFNTDKNGSDEEIKHQQQTVRDALQLYGLNFNDDVFQTGGDKLEDLSIEDEIPRGTVWNVSLNLYI